MNKKYSFTLVLLLGLAFIASRFIGLTKLPVFADEAIYIRWAQLMNQDFMRYVFFPLQDGKPPMHMWMLTQFLPLYPKDPLMMSRTMSVVFGGINVLLLVYLTKLLGGRKFAQVLTAVMYIVLPFTLFHDRMGLIDVALLCFISATLIGFIKVYKTKKWGWVLFSGVFYGLALMTKTPALFFVPILICLGLALMIKDKSQALGLFKRYIVAGVIGLLVFLILRISPIFPALFKRSGDFTFGVIEVVSGNVSHILVNQEKIIRWFGAYATWPILVIGGYSMVALFKRRDGGKNVIRVGLWVVLGVLFLIPFIFFGKVLASRYFLPVMIFLITGSSLILERLWEEGKRALVLVFLIMIMIQSFYFGFPLIFRPESTPFTREDEEQYLTEWSAGYGIPEIRDFVRNKSKTGKIAVATEGYFGTLPDGLLIYFEKDPMIDNIQIFGVGQPIVSISEKIHQFAEEYETYLAVNEHRFKLGSLPDYMELVEEYPRPRGGPSLLLYKVSSTESD